MVSIETIHTNMHDICRKYAGNMQEICRKYVKICKKICRKYAENMQENMQKICKKYARNMQKICRKYAENMHLICKKYAIKYAENMQEYAGICIGAYSAYLAYICTPHFADVICYTCLHVHYKRWFSLMSLSPSWPGAAAASECGRPSPTVTSVPVGPAGPVRSASA